MDLQPGTAFGDFEILSLLGKGGMGAVYRARDPKLHREVAIKVLAQDVAQKPELLARFEREARLLASLNHPNVATLFGIERTGDTVFLVMEVVEGETLAERLERAPLPLEEAREVFGQIADGLEAAHLKGIVHRDLKPANVKCTADGLVKILDFGLAKSLGVLDSSDSGTTLDRPADETRQGTILGTASYMSPEQARGDAVDQRTDVWAFGVCLYEALTGRRAFEGRTPSDALAAVLTREPDPSLLPNGTPRAVRRLLDRCLRKDQRVRLRSLGDARLDLVDEGDSPWATATDGESATARPWLPLTALALAGAALTTAALWFALGLGQSTRAEPRYADLKLPSPWTLDYHGLQGPSIAFSPDGQTIVYVGVDEDNKRHLLRRPLDSHESTVLPGTEGAAGPFFSPDGEWVAFFVRGQVQRLRKVSLETGAVRTICEVKAYSGGQWTADDSIILAQGLPADLYQVSAAGGVPERFEIDGMEQQPVGVHPMPDRRVFLTALARDVQAGEAPLTTPIDLAVVDAASARAISVLDVNVGLTLGRRFTGSGHLLYTDLTDSSLLALPLDPETYAVQGEPVPVLLPSLEPMNGAAQFVVSDDGTLAYLEKGRGLGVRRNALSVVERGDTSTIRDLDIDPQWLTKAQLSPDGRRLLTVLGDGRRRSIWMYDLERSTFAGVANDIYEGPVWAPDSTWFTFSSIPNEDGFGLYRQSAEGGATERILSTDDLAMPGSVSRDGKTVLYFRGTPNGPTHIGSLDLESGTPQRWHGGTDLVSYPSISPTGRWVAYLAREELYVAAFPEYSQAVKVADARSVRPSWSADGRFLYFAQRTGQIFQVRVTEGPALRLGAPEEIASVDGLTDYSLSADGQTIAVNRRLPAEGADSVRLVFDWHEELERLAPHRR